MTGIWRGFLGGALVGAVVTLVVTMLVGIGGSGGQVAVAQQPNTAEKAADQAAEAAKAAREATQAIRDWRKDQSAVGGLNLAFGLGSFGDGDTLMLVSDSEAELSRRYPGMEPPVRYKLLGCMNAMKKQRARAAKRAGIPVILKTADQVTEADLGMYDIWSTSYGNSSLTEKREAAGAIRSGLNFMELKQYMDREMDSYGKERVWEREPMAEAPGWSVSSNCRKFGLQHRQRYTGALPISVVEKAITDGVSEVHWADFDPQNLNVLAVGGK